MSLAVTASKETAAAQKAPSADAYRVFFSHGGEDSYVADILKSRVEASGATVFLDSGAVEYGDDFRQIVLGELARCDELLVLLTPSALKRPWVLAEIGAALTRGIKIIVVVYGPTEAKLQSLGILSLLGPTRLLKLPDFDDYIRQLGTRACP